MNYLELKKKQEELFNSFPMMFAFSDSQFKEGMKKLGLKEEDTDKVVSIGGGGYIRKSHINDFNNLINTLDKELKQLIKEDDKFVYQMFLYELGNHEYCLTYDYEDTLRACGLTYEDIEKDERLKRILLTAQDDYLKSCF